MRKDTYSLTMALVLSTDRGATLETDMVRVDIDPGESWRITFNRSIHLTCGTEEVCREILRTKGYPLNVGWLPKLPMSGA